MGISANAKLVSTCGYLAALSPGAAIYFSFRAEILHRTPLALSFGLIAVIARTFGRGPSILAPIVTAIAFNYFVALPEYAWSVAHRGLLQTAIILLVGFAIAYLFQVQQHAQRKLRVANRALEDRTEALIQAQQGSNSAAWKFDTSTRITSWYEGGSELFGRTLAEVTAMGSPIPAVVEEDRPRILAAAKHTEATGEPFRVEFRAMWPNGEIRWLEACGTPMPSNPSQWLGVTMDITNRKTAELALLRSEKLAAASRLASSVSHEINNPLEAVTNLVYLAKSNNCDSQSRTYLEEAENQLARIAHITSQSLRFHRQQSAPTGIDVTQALREVVCFFEPRLAAANIELNLEARPVPELLCYSSEIRQVLGNLIQNGLEAMPRGGLLRVRVRRCFDPRNGAEAVRVTIANTGSGIPKQTRKRIFEPFFTTKAGANPGLGLWVSAGIVERHGGRIQVWSSVGPERCGTAFSVFLPLHPPQFSATSAPAEAGAAQPHPNLLPAER